jgi:hypothetical protein
MFEIPAKGFKRSSLAAGVGLFNWENIQTLRGNRLRVMFIDFPPTDIAVRHPLHSTSSAQSQNIPVEQNFKFT